MSHTHPFVDLDTLVAGIPDGALLAVPNDNAGVAMAATVALARRGVKDLHLVCLPTSGLQAEVLIGAGCVGTLETSAVTLGEFGTASRFVQGLRAGAFRMRDATCPAVHAAVQAGMKGLPFIPLRGMIGTDLLARRPDWQVIDNPFRDPGAPPDPIVLLPAIRPDVTVFHAPMADRHGNVFIGRARDLLNLSQASARALVTVERIVDGDLLADPDRSGATVPAIYVEAIAVAPRGSWPVALPGYLPTDEAGLREYAKAAVTPDGFAAWLAGYERLRDAADAPAALA